MPNQNQNGRNVALPEENRPSWRPQDTQQHARRGYSPQDEFTNDGRGGLGQSGYSAGRSDDRSLDYQSRHQSYGGSYNQDEDQSRGDDNRWTSRGGALQGAQGAYGDHRGGQSSYGTQGNYGNHAAPPDRGNYGNRDDNQRVFGTQHNPSWQGYAGTQNVGNYPAQGNFGMSGGYGGQSTGAQSGYGYGQSSGASAYGQANEPGGNVSNRVSHRGKGPAGYQRSDERIKELVSEALSDHHDIDATNIEVTVKDGVVTLAGTVDDRQTKRLAEDAIDHVTGVKDVENKIRVGAAQTKTAGSTGIQSGANVADKSTIDESKKHRA